MQDGSCVRGSSVWGLGCSWTGLHWQSLSERKVVGARPHGLILHSSCGPLQVLSRQQGLLHSPGADAQGAEMDGREMGGAEARGEAVTEEDGVRASGGHATAEPEVALRSTEAAGVAAREEDAGETAAGKLEGGRERQGLGGVEEGLMERVVVPVPKPRLAGAKAFDGAALLQMLSEERQKLKVRHSTIQQSMLQY